MTLAAALTIGAAIAGNAASPAAPSSSAPLAYDPRSTAAAPF